MNRRIFFSALGVVMLAFFAFSSGCGSSTSSLSSNTSTSPDNTTTPQDTPTVSAGVVGREVVLELDSNNDNKPDILDFDGVQQLYARTSGTKLSGDVPFMVWIDSLPAPYSPDIVTTVLTAGVTYTFEVSQNFADSLGGILPDVKIFDPSGSKVSADLTVYPEEQPSMILFTFTPSVSGSYSIQVCNADGNSESDDTDCVLFAYKEMHNSEGENGYYARFIISNSDGSVTAEASVPEIIQLRKNFLAAHPYYLDEVYSEINDNGTLNRNNESGEDITENLEGYAEWMSIMNNHAGIIDTEEDEDEDDDISASEYTAGLNAADDMIPTQIPARVVNVPYEPEYDLGVGVMATTNLQPFSETALEAFNLNVPVSGERTGSTIFNYAFISSKEDYEQKMGRNFSMGLAKGALGVSAGVQSTNDLKFGITSTTLVIHYEELEAEYRHLNLSQYKLTEEAREMLSSDRDAFREEYGDYFVSGYQYGGLYEAHISITTETSEQLKEVRFQIGAKLNTMKTALSGDKGLGVSGDMKFSQETQEILNKYKAEITVEIKTIGAGKKLPTSIPLANSRDISAMNNVVAELTNFRNSMASSFTPNTYVPVNVEFRRYRSLPGMSRKIDALIPVDANHSANIMSFNTELVALRGYYNFLKPIQMNGKDEYTNKFNDIVNPIKAAGNAFYNSASSIANALPRVRALSKELKAVGDRYTFYTMLVSAQAAEGNNGADQTVANKPFGKNGGSTGYQSFALSTAVTNDLAKGAYKTDSCDKGWEWGVWQTWQPSYDAGENYRFSWFQVTALNANDNIRDVTNAPAVGKRRVSFNFEGGRTRDGTWKIERQSIYMPTSLYPFSGLKD